MEVAGDETTKNMARLDKAVLADATSLRQVSWSSVARLVSGRWRDGLLLVMWWTDVASWILQCATLEPEES